MTPRFRNAVLLSVLALPIFAGAAPGLSETGSKAPERPWRDMVRQAEELAESGNYGEALSLAARSLAEAEKASEGGADEVVRLVGEKAYLHWMLGQEQEARRAIDRLSSYGAKNFEAQLQLGRIHLLQRNYAAAESALEKAYFLKPQNADVAIQRGRLFAATGRVERAAAAFEAAVRARPDNYWLYGELARCYALLGKKDLMTQTYDRARKHADGDMQHYVVLGYSYLKVGDSTRALAAFEEAAALSSDQPWGYRHLGSYYQSIGRTREAAVNYERLLALFEKKPEKTSVDILHVTDQLAEIYLSGQKPAYAESVARRVLKLKGRIGEDLWTAVFPHGAEIYARLGRSVEVDRLYAEEIQDAEDRPVDRLYLVAEYAKAAWRLKDQGRARALIRRVESGASSTIEISSYDARARLALALNTAAEVSWGLGDRSETERLFKKSLSLWPRWKRQFEMVTAVRGLARCYQASGKKTEARDLLERAVNDLAAEPPARFDDLDVTSQQEDDLAYFIDELLELYRREGAHSQARTLASRAKSLEAEGRLKPSKTASKR